MLLIILLSISLIGIIVLIYTNKKINVINAITSSLTENTIKTYIFLAKIRIICTLLLILPLKAILSIVGLNGYSFLSVIITIPFIYLMIWAFEGGKGLPQTSNFVYRIISSLFISVIILPLLMYSFSFLIIEIFTFTVYTNDFIHYLVILFSPEIMGLAVMDFILLNGNKDAIDHLKYESAKVSNRCCRTLKAYLNETDKAKKFAYLKRLMRDTWCKWGLVKQIDTLTNSNAASSAFFRIKATKVTAHFCNEWRNIFPKKP